MIYIKTELGRAVMQDSSLGLPRLQESSPLSITRCTMLGIFPSRSV